jgi:hypothetical protein
MAKKQKETPPPPLPAPRFSLSDNGWLRILVLVQLVLFAVEFSPDFSTNGDDAKYYLLGKSLTSGTGYHDIFDARTPVHKQYPPLFPGFLGIIGIAAPSPLIPKIAVGILSCCTLVLLFYFLRRFTSRNVLLPTALFCAFSATLASHATLLMSEMFYCFAVAAALYLYDRSKLQAGMGLLFWAAAFAMIGPVFVRTIGIAFLAAWAVNAVIDKRYKQAAAGIMVFVVVTVALKFIMPASNAYLTPLIQKNTYDPELGYITVAEALARIGRNGYLYLFSILPETIAGVGLPKTPSIAVGLAATAVIIVGWVRNFSLPGRIISLYILFYSGIIALWQVEWTNIRFFLPILPFVVYLFFLGIETIFIRTSSASGSKRTGHVLAWTCAALFTFGNLIGHLDLINSQKAMPPDWRNFYSCADWVRLNTPKNAVVVNRKPELFYLRSQRKGFVYPFSHDVEKVISGMKSGGATYCVLDNFSWSGTSARYLFPAVMYHPEMFRVVYALRNPDTFVLEFLPK